MANRSERWHQIEELFHAALQRETAERDALLAPVAPDIRREVESLLAQRTADGGLSRPSFGSLGLPLVDETEISAGVAGPL